MTIDDIIKKYCNPHDYGLPLYAAKELTENLRKDLKELGKDDTDHMAIQTVLEKCNGMIDHDQMVIDASEAVKVENDNFYRGYLSGRRDALNMVKLTIIHMLGGDKTNGWDAVARQAR